MISCLRGFLYEIGPESIIIDLNGLGLEVLLHQRALAALPRVGESLFLHTHLQVLDNDFKLYGFLEKEELKLFKTLLGVSGMGAKGAMNILAAMENMSRAGAAYRRIARRLNGEDVPIYSLEDPENIMDKFKKILKLAR